MSLQDLELDAETIKIIGMREHESCLSTRAKLLEEHSASFKWLMASLLAINAGALTMVKDAITANVVWGSMAGICFFVGIACSLLIARFGQKAVQDMVGPVSEAVAFWLIVSATGVFVKDVYDSIGVKIKTAVARGNIPSRFGFAAFAAFAAGSASLGAAHLCQNSHSDDAQLQSAATKMTYESKSPAK